MRTVTKNIPSCSSLIKIFITGQSESQINSHSSQYSFKIIKKKFSQQIVCRKTDLKVSICFEYNCRMCSLIQTVFTMINNPLFPELSPQEIFATEQQKLSALQNHYSFNETFKRGNPVPETTHQQEHNNSSYRHGRTKFPDCFDISFLSCWCITYQCIQWEGELIMYFILNLPWALRLGLYQIAEVIKCSWNPEHLALQQIWKSSSENKSACQKVILMPFGSNRCLLTILHVYG